MNDNVGYTVLCNGTLNAFDRSNPISRVFSRPSSNSI